MRRNARQETRVMTADALAGRLATLSQQTNLLALDAVLDLVPEDPASEAMAALRAKQLAEHMTASANALAARLASCQMSPA